MKKLISVLLIFGLVLSFGCVKKEEDQKPQAQEQYSNDTGVMGVLGKDASEIKEKAGDRAEVSETEEGTKIICTVEDVMMIGAQSYSLKAIEQFMNVKFDSFATDETGTLHTATGGNKNFSVIIEYEDETAITGEKKVTIIKK